MPHPYWTEQIYKHETGEDFLGLRSVSANITGFLIPGVITITPRARYYSFYAWCLTEYRKNQSNNISFSRFIKRREQIFALANLVYEQQSGIDGTAGLIGKIRLSRHLNENREGGQIPLNADDYLQAPNGGFNQYSGVFQNLGITTQSEDGDDDFLITNKCLLLSEKFSDSISNTKYYKERNRFDIAEKISLDTLEEYGDRCFLSNLKIGDDREAIEEILFAYDQCDSAMEEPIQNMAGTFGLLLEMAKLDLPLSDALFRQHILYGRYEDYGEFSPSKELTDLLNCWQVFQLRELYNHALYEIWIFFLHTLQQKGPLPLSSFYQFLENEKGIQKILKDDLKFEISERINGEISLLDFVSQVTKSEDLFTKGIDKTIYDKSTVANNEVELYKKINEAGKKHEDERNFWLALILLIKIALRLISIIPKEDSTVISLLEEGQYQRKSLKYFSDRVFIFLREEKSLIEFVRWIVENLIISQHIQTSLQKWQQREVNTFHFENNNGLYFFRKMDRNGLSASRFIFARNMLEDLGLIKQESDSMFVTTKLGKATASRIKETYKNGPSKS
jgi:hypothetical protein